MTNKNTTLNFVQRCVIYTGIFVLTFAFLSPPVLAFAYTTPNIINARFISDGFNTYFNCQFSALDAPEYLDCKNELQNFEPGETIFFSSFDGFGLNDGVQVTVDYFATDDPFTMHFVQPNSITTEFWGDHNGYILTNEPPQPPAGPAPLRFSLTKPGEPNLLASVSTPLTESVIETGKAIWPMFVFVGVLLAFVIALQVVVFSKRAVGAPAKTSKKRAGGKNRIPADVDPRDYRAYRRGKKLIEKDSPDFYKN